MLFFFFLSFFFPFLFLGESLSDSLSEVLADDVREWDSCPLVMTVLALLLRSFCLSRWGRFFRVRVSPFFPSWVSLFGSLISLLPPNCCSRSSRSSLLLAVDMVVLDSRLLRQSPFMVSDGFSNGGIGGLRGGSSLRVFHFRGCSCCFTLFPSSTRCWVCS